VTFPPVTLPPVPVAPRLVPEAAQRLLDLVNTERAKAGLGQLTSRADVVTIASAHSLRMAAAGNIFHNDAYFSDATRLLLNSRARGENVAQNSSVDDTHARLMSSPGHRANILDPRFSVVGFAVVQASDGRYYTTQDFLQPAGGVPVKASPPSPRSTPAPPRPVSAPAVAAPPAPPSPLATAAPPAAPATASSGAEGLVALVGQPRHTLAVSSGGGGLFAPPFRTTASTKASSHGVLIVCPPRTDPS